MKWACMICWLVAMASGPLLHAELALQPHDRVAVCGPDYSRYLKVWLLMSQPVPDLDVAQFDWSAGNPTDLLAHLSTDLLPFKPNVVLLDLDGNVETYEKAQTDLVEALKKNGVRIIVLGSPRCVDSFGYQNDPTKAAAENKRLATLAEIARKVATQEGILYADVYGISMASMVKLKALHGDSFIYDSERDANILTVAYAFLKALGCTEPIGTITVDLASGKAEASPGQKIVSFQDNTLVVESTRQPFHFPGSPSGRADPDPFLQGLPFNDDVNRFVLVVKNPPTAVTKVYWKDENHDYTAEELAKGVNLTSTMLNRAFSGQSENVGGKVYASEEQEQRSGNALRQDKPDPDADAKRATAWAAAKASVKPLEQKFRFQPLIEWAKQPQGPVTLIFDTDMASDCDDVGALALLNSFMVRGEANLIACVTNAGNGDSGAVVQAINTWYGHPSIPIGSYHGEAGPDTKMTSVLAPAPPEGYHGPGRKDGSHYTVAIHQQFCPDFPTDDKLPSGVDIYRKALASAADNSVVIVSVGLMENIQDLVQSQPDSVSDLSGIDLVKKKVRELVIMANTVPQDGYLLSKWPTPILWTTDVGSLISTGRSLQSTPENNPVRVAYSLFGDSPERNALKNGRQSWDLTASWLAVRGPDPLWDVIAGRPQNLNDITHSPPGPYPHEAVITIKMPGTEVSRIMGEELARPPK